MIHSLRALTTLFTAILLLASCNKNPVDSDTSSGKVVFVSSDDGKLYTQNLDGSNRKHIYIRDVEETITPILLGNVNDETIMNRSSPRWNPDGTRIALVVDVATDQSQLIVMDADGRNAKTASPDPQMVFEPDWSPDGTKIAYTMSISFYGTFREIFITDLETDTWKQLTRLSTQVGNLGSPRWSNDGKKIFFLDNMTPYELSKIYAYSFESDTTEVIGTWQNAEFMSRNGNRVFGTDSDGDIFSYIIIDQQEKMLTYGVGPRLINFDRQIIFIRGRYPNYSHWLMTTEGSDIHSIDSTGEFVVGRIDIFWK